jgi:Ca2+-binding RTX toxin-like protein
MRIMPTYNLDAADLITLLRSTDQLTTDGQILEALIQNGEFPGPISSLYHVETDIGPSGGSSLPTQDDVIASGAELELITLPTSTAVTGSPFPAPTIGSASPVTAFNFVSPGGVVIGVGDQAVDVTDFGAGHDTLVGGAGYERLAVTGGPNLLVGGAGYNTLMGGVGDDTLIGGGRSRLVAGAGNNSLLGGALAGAQDTLVGGSGKDLLRVTEGDNRLVGGSGANSLYGGSGEDSLVGGASNSLIAGAGNNRLVAGAGSETLVGGGGNDSLVATSAASQLQVTFGSGSTRFVDRFASGMDTQAGASATIAAGAGASRVILGDTGTDSITSGFGAMSILSTQTAGNLVSNSSTSPGGAHTLTFQDGQTIVVGDFNSNITIHFQGGGTTTL